MTNFVGIGIVLAEFSDRAYRNEGADQAAANRPSFVGSETDTK